MRSSMQIVHGISKSTPQRKPVTKIMGSVAGVEVFETVLDPPAHWACAMTVQVKDPRKEAIESVGRARVCVCGVLFSHNSVVAEFVVGFAVVEGG